MTAAKRARASDRALPRSRPFVTAGAIERYSLRTRAALDAPEPARSSTLAVRIARANVRAQFEFGFER